MDIHLTRIEGYHSPNEGRIIGNNNYTIIETTVKSLTGNSNLTTSYWTSGSTGLYSIKAIADSGNTLDAIGNYSIAHGINTIASGLASHAEGWADTNKSSYSIAIGKASHVEGTKTTAINDYSHAEGITTISSGDGSHSEGELTIAIGESSHSEGWNTTSIGNFSHSEGYNTTTIGTSSHVSGQYNVANADYSQIIGGSGNTTYINAIGSVIIGASGVTAIAPYTTYVGKLNIKALETGTSVNNLGIDSNGNIVTASTTSISTYKIYTALLTQTAETPTVIVLENTLGNDIVWSTNGVNPKVTGTLANAFPFDRTWYIVGDGKDGSTNLMNWVSDSSFDIGGSYNQMMNTPVEIRVYN